MVQFFLRRSDYVLTTMPASAPPRNFTLSLPNELLMACLGYLRQPTLLEAARVSRRWRAMATTLPDFYRFHSFIFSYPARPGLGRTTDDSSIAVLESVLHDADRTGYNLSLRLYIGNDEYSPSYETDEDDYSASAYDLRPLGQAVARLVCRAAPRLVALSLIAIAPYIDILFKALQVPAPYLHTFRITLTDLHGSDLERQPRLPENLFCGSAPRLTALCLGDIGPMPSTASFPAERELALYYVNENYSLADVHACWPNVRHLAIEHLPDTVPLLPEHVAIFLCLDSLAFGPGLDLRVLSPAFDKIRAISIIEFTNWRSLSYVRQLMPRRDSAAIESIHLLLAEHVRPEFYNGADWGHPKPTGRSSQLRAVLTFGTPPGDWERFTRRIVDCDITHNETINYLASFGIVSKLTAVEIDDRHVAALIRTFRPLPRIASLAVVLVEWARVALNDDGPEADSEPVCACGRDPTSCGGTCEYFAEQLGGSWATLAALGGSLPALHTLTLRPTCVNSYIGADVLQVLAQLCPDRLLHLELWHGLSISGGDLPEFASISSFGILEPPSDTVSRVAALIKQEANRKANLQKSAALGRGSRELFKHKWMDRCPQYFDDVWPCPQSQARRVE